MRHAKLIHSFNNRTLDFIEKWNSGHFNVYGFEKAKNHLEELFLIEFLIKNYNEVKHNNNIINKYINTSEIKVSEIKLTYRHFSKIEYLRRNYFKCICDVSKKLNISYKELDNKFTDKYTQYIKPFTYDIVNTPSFKISSFPRPPKPRIIK
jgi:hypothetical protein